MVKCNSSLAPWGEGARRAGEGLQVFQCHLKTT